MREGATVAINYLPAEEADAQDLAELLLEEFPDRPLVQIPGNLLNQTFCDELVHRAVEQLGALDILVNNAGYGNGLFIVGEHKADDLGSVGGVHNGPDWRNITTQPRDEFRRIFDTNVFVPYYLTQTALPYMRPGSSLSEQ